VAGIDNKIKAYLKANSKTWEDEQDNIIIQNDSDGKGTYIHTWSVDGLDKPTEEQLNLLETEATKLENNKIAISNRQTEYGSIIEQIEYITENGLDAWQTKVQEIKTKYPKE
tara:strand:- start:27 stop:362 length:336 start_codon:yes stop_codon:yes gene_type:complete